MRWDKILGRKASRDCKEDEVIKRYFFSFLKGIKI